MKKYQEEDAPVYLGYIDQLIGKFGKDGHAVTNAVKTIIFHLSVCLYVRL